MIPINREEISLYEEAKAGLGSLIQQTATVFIGFVVMLLVTGGAPSGFVVALSFCLGTAFVAWSEQKRMTKMGVGSTDNNPKEQFPVRDSPVVINSDSSSESSIINTPSMTARLYMLIERQSDLDLQLQKINQAKFELASVREQLILSNKADRSSVQKLMQKIKSIQCPLEIQIQIITVQKNAIDREIERVRKDIDEDVRHKEKGLQDTEFTEKSETLFLRDDFDEIQHELNEILRKANSILAR